MSGDDESVGSYMVLETIFVTIIAGIAYAGWKFETDPKWSDKWTKRK